jgi:hypothetical protein
MTIRTTLARWLAPEAFRTVERYHYLRATLSEAERWLGYDFPEVDATIMWAKVSEVNHFRALDAPSVAAVPGKPWIWSISDFREHLRAAARERSEHLSPRQVEPPIRDEKTKTQERSG